MGAAEGPFGLVELRRKGWFRFGSLIGAGTFGVALRLGLRSILVTIGYTVNERT